MQEIPFTISLRGLVRVDAGKITVSLRSARTTINLETSSKSDARSFLEKGQNLFDIMLKTAQDLVASEGKDTRFSAADLYHLALEKYPYLKRNSWTSHVIASASNHPSQKHYGVKKDFFLYEGKGTYRLKPEYLSYGIAGDNDMRNKNAPE
jgi:hypothetical protein